MSSRPATYVVFRQAIYGKIFYSTMVSCPRDKQCDAERLFRRHAYDRLWTVPWSQASPELRRLARAGDAGKGAV